MQWRAREDYSRLRRSPFGLVQLALRGCRTIIYRRQFECVVRNKKRLSTYGEPFDMAGPGRLFAAARLTPSGPVRLTPPRSTALCAVVELFLFVGSSMSRGHKKRLSTYGEPFDMAGPGRFELPTLRFVAARSIQLSYGPLTGCHGGEGGIRTLEEAINPLLP